MERNVPEDGHNVVRERLPASSSTNGNSQRGDNAKTEDMDEDVKKKRRTIGRTPTGTGE